MSGIAARLSLLSHYTGPARTIFGAMATAPTAARMALIDACCRSLLAAGVWAKLGVLTVTAAADSQAALLNWINPRGPSGSITGAVFTTDRGFAGNGTSQFVSSGVSVIRGYALASASMFAWSLTDDTSGAIVGIGTDNNTFLAPRGAGGNMSTRLNDSSSATVAVSDSLGLFTVSRGASDSYDRYKNDTSLGAASVTATAISTGNLNACRGGTGFSTRRIAAFGAGGFLTAADVAALYAALHTYLIGVGATS